MDLFYYIIIGIIPFILIRFSKAIKLEGILSPVVMCYLVGLAIGNLLPGTIPSSIPQTLTEGTIALAIPLILMTSDFKAFLKGAKNIILSFFLAVFIVLIFCLSGAFLFAERTDHAPEVAAMLAGVYTGGTPNMSSIKMAIGADQNIFGILNVADILLSGIYLIFLTSIGPIVFRYLLPNPKKENNFIEEEKTQKFNPHKKNKWIELGLAFLSAIIIVAVSIGISFLMYGKISEALFIILITLFGIGISFIPSIRKLNRAYEAGDYLLLIFSLALGLISDFSAIVDASSSILFFTAFVLIGSILLHVLMCRLFKIDSDTALITSAACIFGPVFIGQVVSVMKNRSMLVPGMAMGVMGYAIGSFLGILIYQILS